MRENTEDGGDHKHNSRGENTDCIGEQPGNPARQGFKQNAQVPRRVDSVKLTIPCPGAEADGTWHTGGGKGQCTANQRKSYCSS